MKNKLTNLNNHLFLELERLNEEELSQDKLIFEVSRAKAIGAVASQIIANGNLMLKAAIAREEYNLADNQVVQKMLEA